MPRWCTSSFIPLILLSVEMLSAAQAINLEGRVVNKQGVALGGAVVRLQKTGLVTGTTVNGTFHISGSSQVTPVTPRGQQVSQSGLIAAVEQGVLTLHSARPITAISIQVHDLNGRLVARRDQRHLGPGSHRLPLFDVHDHATHALVVSLTADGLSHSLMLPGAQTRRVEALCATSSQVGALSSAVAAVDTLRVSIDGVSVNLPLPAYEQSGLEIQLDYTPPKLTELPVRTVAQQNAAKQLLKDASPTRFIFKHENNDPTRDVIGFVAATNNSSKGWFSDADVDKLLNFPKLRAIWIQAQDLTDSGVAKMAKLPHLEDLRVHYMRSAEPKQNIGADFLLPFRHHKNLRVLEVKHCFNMETININKLDGFPRLERLVLDNGASNDQGAEFASKCPALRDISFHRGMISAQAFEKMIVALPNLEIVWARGDDKFVVDPLYLKPLAALTKLEHVGLDGPHAKFAKNPANADFLMPLASVTSLKKIYLDPDTGAALRALKDARHDVLSITRSPFIDLGYIFPVFTALNDRFKDVKESTLPK
jgi:hypothetical protein